MAVRDVVQAAAGALGGAGAYVEDVFSTYLYTGNGSTQTITNGIDLSGEGGLVWAKVRTTNSNHQLYDTIRGATQGLFTDLTDGQITLSTGLTSFNANGFSISSLSGINGFAQSFASWTFRKAPKFFDVVTYTGDGVAGRTVAHNLGSVPGAMIIKCTSTTGSWFVYHRVLTATSYVFLNTTSAEGISVTAFNNTEPTDSVFTLGDNTNINGSGKTYVAYLFAHDAGGFGDDGAENVISCGSFTTDGSGNATVNLGYEPQWVLTKFSSTTSNWFIADNMRGMTDSASQMLRANLSSAEAEFAPPWTYPTATGFEMRSTGVASQTGIYIAIRRGPMKTPESGTEVFAIDQGDTTSTAPQLISNFPVDLGFFKNKSSSTGWRWSSRLTQGYWMDSSSTAAELSFESYKFDFNNGYFTQALTTDFYGWMFRRSPSFFDVVAYTGTGSARTVAHNLGVVPELMIVKTRSNAVGWAVSCGAVGYTNGGRLELTDPFYSEPNRITGTPTTTTFPVGTDAYVNGSARTYVAYLFASLPGVSKVSSYTGTGADINVDCGFSGGARFVLIKRTDSTGDWYVWDSERGIVAGNDPYLLLNSTAAENTSTDYIDPLASGFTVTSSAPAALNASGGSYIFLAIA